MIPKEDWKWFGSAGHFICAHDCRFHLCTLVGNYVVSTVGELWSDRVVREIHAKVHAPGWFAEYGGLKGDAFDHAYMKKFGFSDIGYRRKYETMVFRLKEICNEEECGRCGLPRIIPRELDMDGYNVAGDAQRGHYAMCEKWAAKPQDIKAESYGDEEDGDE